MTSYTYTTLSAAAVAALAVASSPYTSPPANYTQELPGAIGFAEGRIARDLVLLNTRATATASSAANANTISLTGLTAPTGLQLPMQVVERVGVVVSGTVYYYEKSSLAYVQAMWPNTTTGLSPATANGTGQGLYWAPSNDNTIVIAPPTDAAYTVNITGLFVQAPMSASNTTTYIGTNYGDLMFAAVMEYLCGAVLKNYGAASDDPRSAVSWRGQYAELLPGCELEEARRRGLTVDDLRAKRAAQPAAAPA